MGTNVKLLTTFFLSSLLLALHTSHSPSAACGSQRRVTAACPLLGMLLHFTYSRGRTKKRVVWRLLIFFRISLWYAAKRYKALVVSWRSRYPFCSPHKKQN